MPAVAALAPTPPAAGAPAAAPRRLHHIPELLEIHADELAYLWGHRRAALHDSRYTLPAFVALNDRIEAHVAGLLTVPSVLPGLLGPRLLAATDRDGAFAAAYALLRLSQPALSARVVDVFAQAEGARLLGLRDAFAAAPLGGTAPALQALLADAVPERAVAAATALAHHGQLPADDPQLPRLLLDAADAVAAQTWRVLTGIDAALAAAGATPPRPYKPALMRPALRAAVLGCAIHAAQSWSLPLLRRLVDEGDAAALGWLAAVGAPDDDAQLLFAMRSHLALPEQAALLGRFARPAAVPRLLEWMHDGDAVLAAAALEGYTRLTGEELRGPRVTPAPAADADDFEREMAPSVWLPDLARVKAHHAEHAARLAAGTRWNRGHDLGPAPTTPVLARIDLPARWDAGARAALARQPFTAPPPAL